MAGTVKRKGMRFRRGLVVVCLTTLIVIAGIATAIFEVVTHIPGSSVTCGPPSPYLKPRDQWHALFTARVLYVGRVDRKYAMQSGHRFGPWAIARVEHRYWGLPWWSSQVVVLAPGWYQEGTIYFVDGKSGWLPYSKYLPIAYTGACNRTQPLSEAVVDTRILSQGPPSDGVRIIGRTYRRKAGNEGGYDLAPGMQVEIVGPSGSTIVVSDAQAVYDATGLPPGHYSVKVENPDRTDQRNASLFERNADLKFGQIGGRPVYSK